MPSEKDIVVEARELLADPGMEPFLFGVTREVLRALADEVERLRDCHSTKHTHTIDCALAQKRKGEWGKRDNANS